MQRDTAVQFFREAKPTGDASVFPNYAPNTAQGFIVDRPEREPGLRPGASQPVEGRWNIRVGKGKILLGPRIERRLVSQFNGLAPMMAQLTINLVMINDFVLVSCRWGQKHHKVVSLTSGYLGRAVLGDFFKGNIVNHDAGIVLPAPFLGKHFAKPPVKPRDEMLPLKNPQFILGRHAAFWKAK